MTGRLLAALLWLPVVLIAPLRRAAATLVLAFWPSAKLPASLLATPLRLVFASLVVSLAFAGTAWLAGSVVSKLRAKADPEDDLLRFHGGDAIFVPALVLTVAWVIAAALLHCLSVPLAAAATLVAVGLSGGREHGPAPGSHPTPLPEPQTELPETGPDGDARGEDADSGATFTRVYDWTFAEEPWHKDATQHALHMALGIPRPIYDDFKQLSHDVKTPADFVQFANAEVSDEIVGQAAARLRAIIAKRDFDVLAEIHLAMAFTLSLLYADDEAEYHREYPKFPVETLVDKRGDCEDHAILCGAILSRLGHRAALLYMDVDGTGHVALAVEAPVPVEGVSFHVHDLEADMFYCEVTPPESEAGGAAPVNFWLGMPLPEGAKNFQAFPIKPAPPMML